MNSDTVIALHRFPGGLRLPQHKSEQTLKPIQRLATPAKVNIPLLQHRGLPAIATVKIGDRVDTGDMIARADGTFSANVHASISGEVTAIEAQTLAHRSGLAGLTIEISAGKQQSINNQYKLSHDYHREDPNGLRRQVAEAGVVGLGGASFPTALKLSAEADKHLHTLIINGAECAPYISCDEMIMRERAADVIVGIQILLHILQINSCKIAIEKDREQSIDCMRQALSSAADERLQLCLVHAIYPEGGERQLIQVISSHEVPSGGLPVDIGYLCHNVSTALTIAQVFCAGLPLVSRVVTVCGDGVREPQNIEAPLGTSVADLVKASGGYHEGQQRLIVGGPMMGFTLANDQVPIDKGCNCILVMPEQQARQLDDVMPCIRCGACSDVCPASLLPQQLHFMAQADNFVAMDRYHLFDCIECGCCDYVCPSNIPLTEYFRYSKDQLWLQQTRQREAEHARLRFEDRNERLATEQRVRDRARKLRHQHHSGNARQEEIAAAVARAKTRKAKRDKDSSS